MKKDMLNTVLLVCVLVVLIAIAIMMAADSGKEVHVIEAGAHTHDEYVEVSGDTISGDLVVQNLHSNANINGNGANLLNLNASRINSGTIGSARLPSDIDATTLDGLDSFDFSLALHNHHADYYTKTEADARFSLVGHSHTQSTDAETLDGYDSLDFAMIAHSHSPGDADTLDGLDSLAFSLFGHTHLPGDSDTLDGYDSLDFAFFNHLHDASNITSGTFNEARLPQDAIDDSEIETGFGLVPTGGILMWSGSSPPSGWALCDGTNGTPDLQGRFIVGYDPADPDYNNTGNIGGEKTHTLTTSELPSHQHSYSGTTNSNGGHQHSYEDRYWDDGAGPLNVDENDPMSTDDSSFVYQTKTTGTTGSHTHSYSGSTFDTGGGQAHENRPPYYALAFIMKL